MIRWKPRNGGEALASVLEFEGPDRAHFLLDELFTEARRKGTPVPYSGTTPYLNTIARTASPAIPATARSSTRSAR